MDNSLTTYLLLLPGVFFLIHFVKTTKRNKKLIEEKIKENNAYVVGRMRLVMGSFPAMKIPGVSRPIMGSVHSSKFYRMKIRYKEELTELRVFVLRPASKNPQFFFSDLEANEFIFHK
jgi:hypothetical protein